MISKDDIKRDQLKEDFSKVLATPCGRRVLWFLIKDVCGYLKNPADVSNVYNTYFESGKKKIGEALVKRINDLDPIFVFKMAREDASRTNKKK